MKIKNRVMGQKVIRKCCVAERRNDNDKLRYKPYIYKREDVEWIELLSFDDSVAKQNLHVCYPINISEDEEIRVAKQVFRADLDEVFLYTDKEVEVVETNENEASKVLSELLKEWNKQEIEKSDTLSLYCKIHGLDTETTDVDDLKKLVKDKPIAVDKPTICMGVDGITIKYN